MRFLVQMNFWVSLAIAFSLALVVDPRWPWPALLAWPVVASGRWGAHALV